jgi:hypothetical protein
MQEKTRKAIKYSKKFILNEHSKTLGFGVQSKDDLAKAGRMRCGQSYGNGEEHSKRRQREGFDME